MTPSLHRINELQARDCMTRQVVTIGSDYSLRDAAMVLRAAAVSGAPVVDDSGRPIGMLSATDLVDLAGTSSMVAPTPASQADDQRCQAGNDDPAPENGKDWKLLGATGLQVEQLPTASVQQYMSRRIVSVDERATMVDVARVLCREHIHRVLVVDAETRIRGIVSSLDLLAALTNVVDESNTVD